MVGNDRRGPLEYISSHPDVLIGFSDAGTHLRNMAHYNFPLRLLKLVQDAEQRGEPFMTMGQAVYRVTGEIAEWFRIDAGVLAEGKRADLVIWSPAFFGVKPDMVLVGGTIANAAMGDPNASIPTPQPVHNRPMFGSFGGAIGASSLSFVSAAVAVFACGLKRGAQARAARTLAPQCAI